MMNTLSEDLRRVRVAFREVTSQTKGEHKKAALVFEVIEYAVDILDREPGKVGPRGSGNGWGDVLHTAEHRIEQIMARGWEPPTRYEIAIAESVDRVFRTYLTGKEPSRDWKILIALARAKGKGKSRTNSTRKLEASFGLTHTGILKRKRIQCQAIWAQLEHILDAPRPLPPSTGVIWKLAA